MLYKNFFSKRNCVAGQMADGYIKGNPIRQDYLEKVLPWIADRDGSVRRQGSIIEHFREIILLKPET